MAKKDNDIEARIRKLAEARGIDEDRLLEILDGLVHDCKAQEASSINNDGIESQVEYVGIEEAEQAIREATNSDLDIAADIAADYRDRDEN
jgi:flagellar motor switch protein FliG